MFCSCVTTSGGTGEKTPLKKTSSKNRDASYQVYLDFFEEVYQKMDENYYHPVIREDFNKFLYKFDTKIYAQLKGSGKSSDFVRWRSAAFLVDDLKAEDDIFSAFFPPKPAKKYEQKVLGKRIDLGIEGQKIDEGYLVLRVQIRADAYDQGLREKDVILSVDGKDLALLTEEEINTLLTPLEGEEVALQYVAYQDRQRHAIKVVSREYFKQFVFMIPVDVPDVYCLKIERFNRMTAEDITRYMTYILQQEKSSLIIDLRGNPGGPPLAAREISAFFLPPNQEFAYFQRKNKPKASLFVPRIPPTYHYKGDMVILVDEKSGSASELFSGILQKRGRATIMGTNTAGQVFLKHMFPFEDDSMLLLVIARGHHPDGSVFSFDGVPPDKRVEDADIDLVNYAAQYLTLKK